MPVGEGQRSGTRDRHTPNAKSHERETRRQALGIRRVDVSGGAAGQMCDERPSKTNVGRAVERPRLNAYRRPIDHELCDAMIEKHPVMLVIGLDQLGIHARGASGRRAMA